MDGINFGQIEASDVETWLAGLRGDLVPKTYRPDPVRRVTIPKPGGGERPRGIPTIRDRVVQAAVEIVLESIFEADFEDSAYGYRPRRSAIDAVKETHRLLCRGTTSLSYSYDSSGDMTGDGTTTYNYDSRRRLTSITAGTTTAAYGINGFGQRITGGTNEYGLLAVLSGLKCSCLTPPCIASVDVSWFG